MSRLQLSALKFPALSISLVALSSLQVRPRRVLRAARIGATHLHIGVVDRRVQQRRVPQSPAGALRQHGQIIQPATPNSGFLA